MNIDSISKQFIEALCEDEQDHIAKFIVTAGCETDSDERLLPRGLRKVIPNTAVFGPTNFIGTTIASTARMTVYALDEKGRFLRWPDGATAV